MHLTTGCPSSSIEIVPVKPALWSSYQTTGKITYLNDDVTSVERGIIKKEQRELLGVDCGALRETEWIERPETKSTQGHCKLNVCHIGGVTLVESKLDERVLIKETEKQRGEEEETQYEEGKKESDECLLEEIKGNSVMRTMSPAHKVPEKGLRPTLAVQVKII